MNYCMLSKSLKNKKKAKITNNNKSFKKRTKCFDISNLFISLATFRVYYTHYQGTAFKFLVPKLSSITFNEFTIKDSFAFAEEIVHQDSKLFMGSLYVDSLFTNIPLEETINICTNLLYNNEDVIEGINKSEFKNLLSLATQESYFIFNDVLYKQKDGVAMGSPLGPTMANVFLSFYEVKWLEQCPKEFKPVFYRRYVDDIFVLFESAENLSKFRDYFNTRHPDMSFSFEQEKKWKVVIS